MTLNRTTRRPRRIWKANASGVTLAMLFASSLPAHAQETDAVSPAAVVMPARGTLADQARELSVTAGDGLRRLDTGEGDDTGVGGAFAGQWSPIPLRGARPASLGRKVIFGLLGAAGGFFLGGYVGAKIEGHRCACDDPGLQGFLIGAPIGTVGGGYLGVKLAGR